MMHGGPCHTTRDVSRLLRSVNTTGRAVSMLKDEIRYQKLVLCKIIEAVMMHGGPCHTTRDVCRLLRSVNTTGSDDAWRTLPYDKRCE